MREIKFRLWSNGLKVMYTPDNEIGGLWSIPMAPNGVIKPTYKDDILMQFTGRKDKNGKEIYEGDILLFHDFYNRGFHAYGGEWVEDHEDLIGPVVFDSCSFCIDPRGQTVLDDYIPLEQILGHINFEVIGNIYENPELIR